MTDFCSKVSHTKEPHKSTSYLGTQDSSVIQKNIPTNIASFDFFYILWIKLYNTEEWHSYLDIFLIILHSCLSIYTDYLLIGFQPLYRRWRNEIHSLFNCCLCLCHFLLYSFSLCDLCTRCNLFLVFSVSDASLSLPHFLVHIVTLTLFFLVVAFGGLDSLGNLQHQCMCCF